MSKQSSVELETMSLVWKAISNRYPVGAEHWLLTDKLSIMLDYEFVRAKVVLKTDCDKHIVTISVFEDYVRLIYENKSEDNIGMAGIRCKEYVCSYGFSLFRKERKLGNEIKDFVMTTVKLIEDRNRDRLIERTHDIVNFIGSL